MYWCCFRAGEYVLPVNHLQRVVKGALLIETVQNEDAGKYTCTASNRDGQLVNRSVFVTVVGTSPHTSPLTSCQRMPSCHTSSHIYTSPYALLHTSSHVTAYVFTHIITVVVVVAPYEQLWRVVLMSVISLFQHFLTVVIAWPVQIISSFNCRLPV